MKTALGNGLEERTSNKNGPFGLRSCLKMRREGRGKVEGQAEIWKVIDCNRTWEPKEVGSIQMHNFKRLCPTPARRRLFKGCGPTRISCWVKGEPRTRHGTPSEQIKSMGSARLGRACEETAMSGKSQE